MESTPGRRTLIQFLGFLVIFKVVQGYSFILPIRPLLCPFNNPDTHECYSLKTVESNCTEVVKNVCPTNTTKRTRSFSLSINRYGPCYSRHIKTCKNYECQTSCCHGYYRDSNGRCSKAFSTCFHGGTLVNHKCQCPEHFTGDQCETAICDPTCQNGGICSADFSSRRQCHCPPYVNGTFCQIPKCEQRCMNGGECVLNFTSAICMCPNGFTGTFCERALTPPMCPKYDVIASNRHCVNDNECETGEYCCFYDNKGTICTRPQYNCTRHGVVLKSSETHDFPDTCQTCTCRPPLVRGSTEGTLQCYTAGCSGPFVSNQHCCPSYGGNRTCGWPIITNCPINVIKVTVDAFNKATLDYKFKAKDCLGNPLKVRHTSEYFKACTCTFHYHTVIARTKPDFNNNVGECKFNVYVADNAPPVFKSCPPDVYAYTDEKVYWKAPEVSDNVGIRDVHLLSHRYRNGSVFEYQGIYIMYYRAEDWQGNYRYCTFKVFSSNRDSDTQPPQLKARKSTTSNGVIIASSVVGVLAIGLLVLIIVMIRFFRLRSKRLRQARERATNRRHLGRTPNNRQEICSVYSTDPPPYEIAAQDKLPAYTPKPKESPPMYDDVFTASQEQTQAHSNPVYDNISLS